MGFTVAIVGRPNVGKSTFFNRLLEQRKAIVEDTPGVTRDRQYGIADWTGKSFNVIDTGGFVSGSDDMFEREIRKQVMIAVEEANAIVFMVDASTGITDLDESMADVMRRTDKPVLLAVNKVDNHSRFLEAQEFYQLGFEHIFFLSSMSGSGTGELLDELVKGINEDAEDHAADIPRISIIGQPNVGKSSLLNALVGSERTIVSDVAGTTRDTIHTHYKLFQKEFVLIDTAGIRRKSKVNEDLEFYSVIRAIKALDESDVCLLLLDAEKGITQQDLNIFSLAEKKGKGIVLLVNKWDLMEKETNTARDYERELKKRIAPFSDVPILSSRQKKRQGYSRRWNWPWKYLITGPGKYLPPGSMRLCLKPWKRIMLPPFGEILSGSSILLNCQPKCPVLHSLPTTRTTSRILIATTWKTRLREHFNFSGVPVRIFFRKK